MGSLLLRRHLGPPLAPHSLRCGIFRATFVWHSSMVTSASEQARANAGNTPEHGSELGRHPLGRKTWQLAVAMRNYSRALTALFQNSLGLI